jgi:nicotinamide-nucleotide amidase
MQYSRKSYLVKHYKNGYNKFLMQPLLLKIHSSLIKTGKTVAVAESCTGGQLSGLLTRLSGSSKYFILGVVAYHNRAKESLLEVPRAVIASHGAVSARVAALMASKAREIAKTDYGIAITGIAGPTGATRQKPVGTVFIAIDGRNKKICRKFSFKGPRLSIRKKAALQALELLSSTL